MKGMMPPTKVMVDGRHFMRLALTLAKKGLGLTSPNPCVGAIIVKNGKVAGRGYHEKAGRPHAEAVALKDAGDNAKGADIYVTLEPCAHFGRTPPCVTAIIAAGVKRVFVGMEDPNPRVNGRGIRELKKAGIEVASGILEQECRLINEPYIKYITTGFPFVILKLALSLDGKIATSAGESKWITSKESRKYVHGLRSLVDCVMVGGGTLLRDDPALTVRLKPGRNPARAVVDSALKMPLDSRFLKPSSGRVFIFTASGADKRKIKLLEAKGAEVIAVSGTLGALSLKRVLKELAKREIMSVMLEGGSRLAAGALKEGVVDKVVFFIAPKIIGGDGVPAIGELGISSVKKALMLKDVKTRKLGGDLLVEGYA